MADAGLFSADQVCNLAHITEKQLRHWATSDFYKPEHLDEDGGPFSHIYSFRDVVSLRTIGILRNKHHIPLPALRRAGTWLSERHGTPWASLQFRISGKGLYYIDPSTGLPAALTGPLGQHALPGLLKLDAIASRVRRAVAEMKKRKARDIGRSAAHGTLRRMPAWWQGRAFRRRPSGDFPRPATASTRSSVSFHA